MKSFVTSFPLIKLQNDWSCLNHLSCLYYFDSKTCLVSINKLQLIFIVIHHGSNFTLPFCLHAATLVCKLIRSIKFQRANQKVTSTFRRWPEHEMCWLIADSPGAKWTLSALQTMLNEISYSNLDSKFMNTRLFLLRMEIALHHGMPENENNLDRLELPKLVKRFVAMSRI